MSLKHPEYAHKFRGVKSVETIILINLETKHVMECEHYRLMEMGIPDGYTRVFLEEEEFSRDRLAEKVIMAYLEHVGYKYDCLQNSAYVGYEVADAAIKARGQN